MSNRHVHPQSYSAETILNVIEQVAGGATVQEICGRGNYPTRRTFYNRLSESPELLAKYEEAVKVRDKAPIPIDCKQS